MTLKVTHHVFLLLPIGNKNATTKNQKWLTHKEVVSIGSRICQLEVHQPRGYVNLLFNKLLLKKKFDGEDVHAPGASPPPPFGSANSLVNMRPFSNTSKEESSMIRR